MTQNVHPVFFFLGEYVYMNIINGHFDKHANIYILFDGCKSTDH